MSMIQYLSFCLIFYRLAYLRESGLMEFWQIALYTKWSNQGYATKHISKHISNSLYINSNVNLGNLSNIFNMFIFGHIIALIIFLMEKIYNYNVISL